MSIRSIVLDPPLVQSTICFITTIGANKSVVLNSLIGHPVLCLISIDLQRDGSLSCKSIILLIDNKSQQVSASDALQHSLKDRLSKGASSKSCDTAPALKLIDLPGLHQQIMDESLVRAILITLMFFRRESLTYVDELVRLGEQMVQSPKGTRAIALELFREFEDKFLQHITSGEGSSWKIVASFEGKFPNRIKQLPLDWHFDINKVKRIVLEADGYQTYLISPEKGLRSLIKGVLELAKEPSRLCVDEVHQVLVDIVSATASATPVLVIAIVSAALDGFKSEVKKMVVALVDMEMERQRQEEELKNRSSKKGKDAYPQTGGSLKSIKDKPNKAEKEAPKASGLKTAGPEGEIIASFLLKKSAKTNGWSKRWFVLNEKTGKLGYTKKQEERHFHGVITLEECNIEDAIDEEEPPSKSLKDKKANSPDSGKAASLVFKITSKVPYKIVLKAHSAVVLKAESMANKVEWMNKIRNVIQAFRGGKATSNEGGLTMRQSLSDGSLLTALARRRQASFLSLGAHRELSIGGWVSSMNRRSQRLSSLLVVSPMQSAIEDRPVGWFKTSSLGWMSQGWLMSQHGLMTLITLSRIGSTGSSMRLSLLAMVFFPLSIRKSKRWPFLRSSSTSKRSDTQLAVV
ncbi:hypothetical protein UlMin_008548 [Ulmus minor]